MKITGAWDASRRRRWLLCDTRWSVPFSVCSYVHYSAMKPTCTTCTRRRPGGRAAGRRRGGSGAAVGRASTWAQALPTAVDRARAAAARPPFTPQRDVRLHGPVRVMSERHSRREHHEPGAARRSLRPHGASWRLISSEGACLCPRAPPAPCRVPRQIPGPIMDTTAAPAGGAHAGCGCAGATPPTAALARQRARAICCTTPFPASEHAFKRKWTSSAIHRHFPCARLAALMQLGVCGRGPGAFGRDIDIIRARIRVSAPVSGPWGAPFELLYAHGAYCAKCYIKQGLPMRFSPSLPCPDWVCPGS